MSDWQGKRGMDEQASGGAKRTKVEGVSKVLHVRGLPQYTSDVELSAVCQPFGTVAKTLVLQGKNQGFVQMDNADTAASLLAGFDVNPPSIRGKSVYFQYSSREELTIPANRTGGGGGMPDQGGLAKGQILLITIQHMHVPVTLDNLQTIFSTYGEVQKIVCFKKGEEFKALIQMATVEAATNAMALLDGKDIFQGCCRLQIGMSNRSELKIAQQSEKSRDFTLGGASAAAVAVQQMGAMGGYGAAQGGYGAAPAQQQGVYGAAPSFSSPPSSASGGGFYQMGGMEMGGMGAMGAPQSVMGGMGGMAGPAQAMGGMGGMGGAGAGGSPVVLVNNLVPEKNSTVLLARLFGVYGDVMRVKILYNKPDTALVQFFHPQGAQMAQRFLNKAPLHGQELVVSHSKHFEIRLPREGADEKGAELTKDFSDSSEHRYKRQPLQNTRNLNPPSSVLHVANIHDGCTAAELSAAFASEITPNPKVQFFATSRKMAYVGMSSEADSVETLVRVHGTSLGPYSVRVSFSKKSLEDMQPEQ